MFCGGGEGTQFISSHNVGYISTPGDYPALIENIRKLRDMSVADYEAMSARCISLSQQHLDFGKQMKSCYEWLKELK